MKVKKTKSSSTKNKKIIVGNWKLNISNTKDVSKWLVSFKKSMPKRHSAQIVVCPPSLFIQSLGASRGGINLGAQDVSVFEEGSHTGEISAQMLNSVGVKYVIVGHSERRAQGESDDLVSKKVRTLLNVGITPIICVGENSRDNGGMYLGLLKKQILGSIAGLTKAEIAKCVIAYEPVYAIGGKKALESQDVLSMVLYIKKVLIETLGLSSSCPILYGGAVFPETASSLLNDSGCDGLLLGRASADPKMFASIIATA